MGRILLNSRDLSHDKSRELEKAIIFVIQCHCETQTRSVCRLTGNHNTLDCFVILLRFAPYHSSQ